MDGQLDFSLPESDPKRNARQTAGRGALWFVLLAQVVVVILLLRPPNGARKEGENAELSEDALRKLALKLEKQGLPEGAAHAWRTYLRTRGADAEKSAKIWYRIGKVYQEAGQWEKAVEAYYRSESFMRVDSLTSEIGRRVQECLEVLGKFAALRYELAERVGVGEQATEAGEDVVAEVGPMKITRSDLDKQIEQAVARQLRQVAAFMPEDQLKQQQEALLKRFSSDQQRLQLLNQFLIQETLVRKAREDGIADDKDVREALREAERNILAQQVMRKELAAKVNITPGDVQMFYEANKKDFMEAEKVRIAHILVPTKEKAEAVLNSLEKETFEDLAKQISTDEVTGAEGGVIDAWIERGQTYVPGVGQAEELIRAAFDTEPGKVAERAVETEKGFHIVKTLERREARRKSFDECREDAARRLRSQKEREVQEALFKKLFETYEVVVHRARFVKPDNPPEDPK